MAAAAGISGLAIAFLAGGATAVPRKSSAYQKLGLISRVLSYVDTSYVEDVDQDELVYGAIRGMLETLDPHSQFLKPDQYREMKNDTTGQFSGIGIEVEQKDGALTVVSVLEGTPAAKAGLLSGDQILKIDDQPTRGMTDYVQRMRGKRGTQVTLYVVRKGWKDPRPFGIVRELVKVRSVEAFTLEPGYGVIKVKQFTENVDRDVDTALQGLEREASGKLQGLVLDLRNNPGGLLDQAVRVADAFIESGIIVRTEGRNGRVLDEEHAHQRGTRTGFPIICLVNGGSASAAEIVAGALQDHGRGLVMGTQTFGKGSVQTLIELEDGSALKLTIARYFTPSGRSIQERGIAPDVVVEQVKLSEARVAQSEEPTQKERDLQGHLKNKQREPQRQRSGPPPGYAIIAQHATSGEDYQLRTAYDYLKTWNLFASQQLRKPSPGSHPSPSPPGGGRGTPGYSATERSLPGASSLGGGSVGLTNKSVKTAAPTPAAATTKAPSVTATTATTTTTIGKSPARAGESVQATFPSEQAKP